MNQEELNISEGHEDLSFLADAPQPRPPIRSSSRSSHGSGSSPRSTRSNSRSVSPSIVTRSKSIDYDVDEKLSETPEPNISLENASTPIASLTAKRSQRSLGRAVLEKNLKQSLMTDIFGEYSKTGQSLEENPNTSTLSETDTSDVGFLSYEQSGILTGDTLVDQQILKKMIGHETIGDPTMGDSTLRLLNDSSNILSDSSNYEDSKDEISATEAKLVSVDQLQEMLEDEPETEAMETETTEPLVEVAPKNDEQKTLEAISIGDSEESYLEDTEEDDDDDDDDESDKFANKSDDSEDQPLDQHRERTPDDLDDTEEYYEEEQSSLSHDTSYGETASEPSTPGKAPDNEEVISIGSTSDEEDETADEKQLQQFAVQTEPEVPVFVPQEIPTYYNDPSSLNQGLIMSHMEAAHDIPETYAASQSLLYLDVAQNEFHQPQSQMNEVQMSELLYGEVETDTDSLNLAIVEEESRSQEMQPEITEQEVPVQEVVAEEEPVQEVVVEEEQPKKVVKSKVIETKKSEVANARVDFIKEVYDETVVQEVPEEDEEEEEESHVDAPEVVVETEPEQEVVEEEIVVDDDVVEEEVVTTENDEAEIDEPLQVDEVESEIPQGMSTEQSEEKEIQTWLVNAGVVEPQSSEVEKEVVEEEIVEEEVVEEEPAEKSMEPEELVQEDNSDENESELVIDEPTSSHEEEVHESPNTSTEAEKETDEPTSTLQEDQQEAANTSTEPEISVEEPTSSTENQPMAEEETTPVKIDTRKSVYVEDPLDKTSFLPIVDDGIPEDVLNRSNIYKEEPETLVQKLRTRAQSVDPKPTALDSPVIKRNLRATSVPKSNEPLTPRKIRRISVDTQLEQIEEGTPLDVPSTPKRRSTVVVSTSGTPSMLTRSASRRLSTDVAPEPTTPSRNTRGASKERQRVAARRITDKAEETDEEPVTTRTRTRKASTTEDADDNKSEISVKSTRSLRRAVSAGTSRSRLTSVSSSTDTSPVYEDGSASETYSQSRRLTRRQKQMMEKLSQTSSTSFATTMASNDNQSEISDSESVAESTKSTISNVSKKSTASKRGKAVTKSISAPAKRSTRSNSKPDQEPEEIGTRKRKATKPVHLETIPEDDKPSNKSTASEEESHEEAPAEVPVKRTRKARK